MNFVCVLFVIRCACIYAYVHYFVLLVYIYTCTYIHECGCTRMCLCARVGVKHVFIFICICDACMVAWYSDLDPFSEIRTRYRRFGVVPVMDPISKRFEGRSMGWSGDSYRFMQWRPDDDLILKPRHFMWVFAFVLFSQITISSSVYMLLVLLYETIYFTLSV